MRHLILLASSVLLSVLSTLASPAARGSDSAFNPLDFPLQKAICPGINRADNNKTVNLNLGMLPTIASPYLLSRVLLGRIS
jgi:hypothetical protein